MLTNDKRYELMKHLDTKPNREHLAASDDEEVAAQATKKLGFTVTYLNIASCRKILKIKKRTVAHRNGVDELREEFEALKDRVLKLELACSVGVAGRA